VVELAPLRALTTLLELRMVNGTHEMSGVPVSVSALQALTLLSFQGEQRLRKLGAVTGLLKSECKPRMLLAVRLMAVLLLWDSAAAARFAGCRALCTFNDGLRRKPSPLAYLRQLR
jgi:hypothetical protein